MGQELVERWRGKASAGICRLDLREGLPNWFGAGLAVADVADSASAAE